MLTLFISGSDTGIGKTRVVAALARVAARPGRSVQIVKPVQSGGEISDADFAGRLAGLPAECAYTLQHFRAPLAPMAAAAAEGAVFRPADFPRQLSQIPRADLRLVEGSGGVAVPLVPDGTDWTAYSTVFAADAVVLVVADRLGAINQARLVHEYFLCHNAKKIPHGIFLNALVRPPHDVSASTRSALSACGIPIWGELAADSLDPVLHPPLAQLLGL